MRKVANYIVLVFLAGIILFFFLSSKSNSSTSNLKTLSDKNISVPENLICSGDLIFRNGRGFISNAFRKLSLKDPQYSHAGIIHREGNKIFVYHIIGGEGSLNKIRKETLRDFCSPFQSNGFGIYRTDLNAKTIDTFANEYYSMGIRFDGEFKLESDDKMYCTELLYKILCRVSGQNNFITLTELSGLKYVACDNLYLSTHVKKIYSSIN